MRRRPRRFTRGADLAIGGRAGLGAEAEEFEVDREPSPWRVGMARSPPSRWLPERRISGPNAQPVLTTIMTSFILRLRT